MPRTVDEIFDLFHKEFPIMKEFYLKSGCWAYDDLYASMIEKVEAIILEKDEKIKKKLIKKYDKSFKGCTKDFKNNVERNAINGHDFRKLLKKQEA